MSAFFPLARWLAARLPATIHPMILHFPIALLYLCSCLEVLALTLPPEDGFLHRAAFWTITLACVAIIVTMAAGLISEQSVHWTPAMRAVLSRHQHFAVLTGLCAGAAWLLHVANRFPRGRRWGLWGRGRASWLSAAFVLASAVFVTLTAHLGGDMVYHYGAGVVGVTRAAPGGHAG